ncbi:MAG: outer membrane beta-barrel domain-containing protein, partial [Deltaproteobacteria bacterium]
MKNKFIFIIAAGLIVLAANAFAAVKEGEISLSPLIGGYTFDSKQHLKTNMIYGGRVGYNITNNFGVEGLLDYVKTESKQGLGDFKAYRYGGELLYHFFPEKVLVPYIAAGGGGITLKSDDSRQSKGMFDYGVGLKYFVADWFALRGDVRHILTAADGSKYNNIEYTIGIYLPFLGLKPAVVPVQEAAQPKAAPAEAKVVVEPTPQPAANLSLTPASVKQGETAKLSWTSRDASDCSIQPGIGQVPLQGDKSVTPAADTSYTLTCTGPGGSTSSNAAVAVVVPPPAPAAKPVQQSGQKASAAAQRFCNKPAILAIAFDTNKVDIKPKYHT